MSAKTDEIIAAVAQNKDATDSAIALITRLVALVQANVGDPAALQKILDDVKADTTKLSDAVVANTPAEQV